MNRCTSAQNIIHLWLLNDLAQLLTTICLLSTSVSASIQLKCTQAFLRTWTRVHMLSPSGKRPRIAEIACPTRKSGSRNRMVMSEL